MADLITSHAFKSGYSGMSCVEMVVLEDGSGDQCGKPAGEHGNRIDWDKIGRRYQDQMAKLIHGEEEPRLYGNALYAEALRRTFRYAAAGETGSGPRALPYEHLWDGHGLTTEAQADWNLKGATALSRAQAETAEKQVAEMRAEVQRVYREAAADLAGLIRARCNERSVPSRFRREGVAWAADLIDPKVPKDRYGNVLKPAAAEAGE